MSSMLTAWQMTSRRRRGSWRSRASRASLLQQSFVAIPSTYGQCLRALRTQSASRGTWQGIASAHRWMHASALSSSRASRKLWTFISGGVDALHRRGCVLSIGSDMDCRRYDRSPPLWRLTIPPCWYTVAHLTFSSRAVSLPLHALYACCCGRAVALDNRGAGYHDVACRT